MHELVIIFDIVVHAESSVECMANIASSSKASLRDDGLHG
jgi:hypothetical protein